MLCFMSFTIILLKLSTYHSTRLLVFYKIGSSPYLIINLIMRLDKHLENMGTYAKKIKKSYEEIVIFTCS